MKAFCFLISDDGSKLFASQLTLDDLFNRHFQVHDPDAKWISGVYIFEASTLMACT